MRLKPHRLRCLEPVLNKMTDLMRAVDAYAFDYARDGKMAKTRRDVEHEIAQALADGCLLLWGLR